MKPSAILYSLLFTFSLLAFSCSSDDEPKFKLFSVTPVVYEGEAAIKMGPSSVTFHFDGWGGMCYVELLGDFDSYNLSEGIPSWITVKTQIPNKLVILISETVGQREGKVEFTVFKGGQSESGSVIISQSALTEQDFKVRQQKAIDKFLSSYKIQDAMPTNLMLQTGPDAPFYKIQNDQCTCYMQVISRGQGSTAKDGELIYIRFRRYNLISFLKYGELPIPEGNANSLSYGPISFKLGQSSMLGSAIQMPLILGLPIDSEVNLVIPAEYGFTAESTYYIPFLYNVRYYAAAI